VKSLRGNTEVHVSQWNGVRTSQHERQASMRLHINLPHALAATTTALRSLVHARS